MTSKILALAATGALGLSGVAAAQSGSYPTNTKAATAVGTVTSYASGKLTVTLTDGSTVTGKVTRATHISCRALPTATTTTATTTTAAPARAAQAGGPQGGPLAQGGQGPQGGPGQQGGRQGGPQFGGGAGRPGFGDDDSDKAVCDTSSLTAGTVVLKAGLDATATGLRFGDVVLQDAS